MAMLIMQRAATVQRSQDHVGRVTDRRWPSVINGLWRRMMRQRQRDGHSQAVEESESAVKGPADEPAGIKGASKAEGKDAQGLMWDQEVSTAFTDIKARFKISYCLLQ